MNDAGHGGGAADRAAATWAAIGSPRLYQRHKKLFGARPWWRLGRRYECLWPFADTWSALCSLASLPDRAPVLEMLEGMLVGLGAYGTVGGNLDAAGDAGFSSVVTAPLGRGGDRFYDDNAWLGLALVRHHQLTGAPEPLRLARRVFSFVVSGWSTEAAWACPGGIRWKEPLSNRSRNTCANGPAAELAATLHERTGEGSFLDWARRIYEWTRNALRGPDALYVDRIAPDGARDPTIWSYNQGSMIGAGVLLTQQTGDASFVDQAAETAAAYLDGRGVSDLMTQDPAFNAVLFRNLFVLDAVRPDARSRELALAYGSAMWRTERLRHGLFAGKGSALNNTAGMLQIYALLAGAAPHP